MGKSGIGRKEIYKCIYKHTYLALQWTAQEKLGNNNPSESLQIANINLKGRTFVVGGISHLFYGSINIIFLIYKPSLLTSPSLVYKKKKKILYYFFRGIIYIL